MHKTTRQLITEITLRAVVETLPEVKDAKSIDVIADGLIDLVERVVVGIQPNATIACDSYRTFVIWNQMLDKIEKEIPVIAGKMEVAGTVTRTQRSAFYGTAPVDRDRQGGIGEVAR